MKITRSGSWWLVPLALFSVIVFALTEYAPDPDRTLLGLLLAGLLGVVCSTLASALHEVAHVITARRLGGTVTGVELRSGGPVTTHLGIDCDPVRMLAVAVAGPLAEVAVGGLLLALAPHLPELLGGRTLTTSVRYAALLALVLATANALLPVPPCDGRDIWRGLRTISH